MTIEEKSLRQSSQKLGHSSLRIQTLVMWKAGEARAGTQDTSTWSGNSHSAGESIKLLGPINYACRLTLNLIFKLLPPSPPPPPPAPACLSWCCSPAQTPLSRLQTSPSVLPFISTMDICGRTILFFFFFFLRSFLLSFPCPLVHQLFTAYSCANHIVGISLYCHQNDRIQKIFQRTREKSCSQTLKWSHF